jgi:type VI secretion system protein ImpB
MPKEGSVAPKERVNIVYRPATGNAKEEVELPLKMMVLGDFTLREEEDPLEERAPINVDKDNFTEVMRKQNLGLTISVADRLSDKEGEELAAALKIETLKDFSPERIARQVPELAKLMELRDALSFLKGPLGNVPAFRKHLQSMIDDPEARERLMKELKAGQEASDQE